MPSGVPPACGAALGRLFDDFSNVICCSNRRGFSAFGVKANRQKASQKPSSLPSKDAKITLLLISAIEKQAFTFITVGCHNQRCAWLR